MISRTSQRATELSGDNTRSSLSADASGVTGRSLISNSFWNVGYQIIPVGVALICIPLGVRALGVEVFGLYSLAATILVLSSLLNLGIAPAVTLHVARFTTDARRTAHVVVYGSMLMLIIAGALAGGLYLAAGSPGLFTNDSNAQYAALATRLIRMTAWMMPLVMLVLLFRAVLEGKHLFRYTALSRAFTNSVIMGAPSFAGIDGFTVVDVMRVVAAAFSVAFIALGVLVLRNVSFSQFRAPVEAGLLRELIHSGGWISLASGLTAALIYIDRFIIARYGDLASVAYYVAVFDVVARLSIVSGSLTAVLFPAISYWYSNRELRSISKAITRAYKVIGLTVSMAVLVLIVFAYDFLDLWLGSAFAENGTLIMQVLSLGVLLNCLAAVPYRAIVAMGFPRFVAQFYLLLTPLHIVATVAAVSLWGAIGAALTYGLRAAIEVVVLNGYLRAARHGLALSKFGHGAAVLTGGVAICATLGAFWLAGASTGPKLLGTCSLVAAIVWTFYMGTNDAERSWMKRMVRRRSDVPAALDI